MDQVSLGSRVLQLHRQLLADGERIALGKRALDILSALAEARGEIVTKEELFEAVWPDVIVEENALQVQIAAIRKALGEDAERLRTIRGIGYQLELGDAEKREQQDTPASPNAGAQLIPEAVDRKPKYQTAKQRLFMLALAAVSILLATTLASSHFLGLGLANSDGTSAEVMVMPFEPAGGNPDEKALASGITSALIVSLRRVPKLRVLTGAENAREVDAKNLIQGTIQLNGDKLRVSTTLTDRDGEVLWSESFGKNLNDLFQVEQDIARRVANSLSVSLDVGFNSREYGGTDNPEAYANFIQGRAQFFTGDLHRAAAYLERAVELDPNYALAWGSLAAAYGNSLYLASTKEEANDLLAKEDNASARAITISPGTPRVQISRLWYEITTSDFVAADARYHKVAKLDSGDIPELKSALAQTAAQFGRIREALKFEQEAALIDPAYERDTPLLLFLIPAGRYDDAIDLFNDMNASTRGASSGQARFVYWAYLFKGDLDKAKQVAKSADLDPYYQNVPNFRFDSETIPDLPAAKLERWANREFGDGGRGELIQRAMFASNFGHQELALRYLKLAFNRFGFAANVMLWHPALAKLRKTEGFVQFINNRGIIDAWRQSGDWGDFCKQDSVGKVTCI